MTAIRILLVVALQTLALGGMVVQRQAMLDSSRVITLKVVPVDPNDMFRGDYVTLNYGISQIDTSKVQGEKNFSNGDTVFVTVAQQGGQWTPVALARTHPATVPTGSVVLKGTIAPFWVTGHINVAYGVESYFVSQGTGQTIEQEARNGDLSADIAVSADGRSAIKAMRRKSGVFYVEGLF